MNERSGQRGRDERICLILSPLRLSISVPKSSFVFICQRRFSEKASCRESVAFVYVESAIGLRSRLRSNRVMDVSAIRTTALPCYVIDNKFRIAHSARLASPRGKPTHTVDRSKFHCTLAADQQKNTTTALIDRDL